jgi:hypothetical protein
VLRAALAAIYLRLAIDHLVIAVLCARLHRWPAGSSRVPAPCDTNQTGKPGLPALGGSVDFREAVRVRAG